MVWALIALIAAATYGVLALIALPFRKREYRPSPPRVPSLSEKVGAELARFEERKRLIALLPLESEEIEAAIEEEAANLSMRVKEVLDE